MNQSPPETLLTADTLPEMVSAKASPLFPLQIPIEAEGFLRFADELKQQIDQIKQTLQPESDLWKIILQKLRVDWTYHSNSIEGSTLSRGDTMFFLTEGLTVEGKPLKDFLDAQNHADAIDILFDVVAQARPLSEGFIKEINALLLNGVSHTVAKNQMGHLIKKPTNAGRYKILPNHVQKQDGTLHQYVLPEQVGSEMETLIAWIHAEIHRLPPIMVAAVAHYNMVRIHPFDDGNGRGARILMNMILLQKGYFPAIIRREAKRQYLEALEAADHGDLSPFILFIAGQLIETEQSVLQDLTKSFR